MSWYLCAYVYHIASYVVTVIATSVFKKEGWQKYQKYISSVWCDKMEHAFKTFWTAVWWRSHCLIVLMDFTRITTRGNDPTATHLWTHFCVYEAIIKAKRGCIYVTEIYPRPDLKGQPCYSWPAGLNLASLTQEAIKTSMDAAEDMLEVEISSDEKDEQPRYVIPWVKALLLFRCFKCEDGAKLVDIASGNATPSYEPC